MKRSRVMLVAVASLLVGVVIGGNVFSRTQPRSIIALRHCENCLSFADLAGLLASVGVHDFPGLIPNVVVETHKTIAIQLPGSSIHYVIIPKKDLKDLDDISEPNFGYLTDAYLVARQLIEKRALSSYRLYTNGPGRQNVTYLHFHLVSP